MGELQVIDCNERAVHLRALVSAESSPKTWDRRCFVRKKLIAFLAREYPHCLPRVRAEVESAGKARHAVAEGTARVPAIEPEVGGLPWEPEENGLPGGTS